MVDDATDAVLPMLIEMRAEIRERFNRLDERLDNISGDLQDIKVRMTSAEEGIAGVNRRLDRLDGRIQRIERRLDLVEAE